MGLKCRLLGHTYGDPEVERNREERGDEVVVTIREVQTCARCGDEQVVSQNKEVTAIRSPAASTPFRRRPAKPRQRWLTTRTAGG